MRNRFFLLTMMVAVLAIVILPLGACKKADEASQQVTEEAAEIMEEAAETAEEMMEEGAEAAEEMMEEGAEAAEEMVEEEDKDDTDGR